MASSFLRIVVSVAVLSCTQGFSVATVLDPSISVQPLRLRNSLATGVTGLQLRGGGPFQVLNKLFGTEEKKAMTTPKIIIAGAVSLQS